MEKHVTRFLPYLTSNSGVGRRVFSFLNERLKIIWSMFKVLLLTLNPGLLSKFPDP